MSKALLKSTAVVSAMTLVSRILGLVRDMVYAQVFGAGANTDAFFVAFRIPNFMRRLFAEGGFSQAFVPVFAQYRQRGDEAELRALVARVFGTLGLILTVITILGMLAAPLLVWVFAPGFGRDPEKFTLTTELLRITLPYLVFISMTACAGAILNSMSRFAVPALTPVLLNLCMIGAALWGAPLFDEPVRALAWGVFAAGMVQLLFQLPYLARLGLLPRPRWGWRSDGVQRILRLMIPTLFGTSVAQINVLVGTLLASFLVSGSVTWLYYADRLMEFPHGLLGVALGTVILPSLSAQHAARDPQEFSATLDWALRLSLLVGVPASVALCLLATPLLVSLFQYGAFTAVDARMASNALIAYSIGLLGFILVKVLAPGFFAREDTRTPVRIAVRAVALNIVLSLALIAPLAHVGLALATALAACFNAASLLVLLRRDGIWRPQPGWRTFGLRLVLATTGMAAVLWWGGGEAADWLAAGTRERVQWLAALVLGGGLSYTLALLAVGMRPRDLWRR